MIKGASEMVEGRASCQLPRSRTWARRPPPPGTGHHRTDHRSTDTPTGRGVMAAVGTTHQKFAEKNGIDFAVADLGEADFGRREIRLAEHEMPGLMALRR